MASKSLGTVGKANLNIVPKFDNLGSTIKKTLDGIDTSSSGSAGGSAYGESFTVGMGSMLGGGAIAGVMASITSEVTSILSDAVMGAVQRSDILANFPKQMSNLGFSTDEATESIETMSDRLTGLPTSLSDMASVVTGIAAITGDLDLSTEAGLALNDMLLASGSSTTLTSAAMEQFRQILAKGKPDMQDWKSLTQAMPGQMNQLAEEMLGAGATADDLYKALGGGGEEATISTTDLLNAMIKLDNEGGDNIIAFKDQALDATGGIETSMSNMEIAIERGIAGVIDSIGRENITGVITGIGDTFESALDVMGGAIDTCRPLIDAFIGAIEAIAPYAEPAIVALGGFATLSFGVSEGVGALSKIIGETEHIFGPASTMAGKLSDAFWDLADAADDGSKSEENFMKIGELFSGAEGGAIVAGIGAIITAVAIVATTFYDAWEKEEAYKKSTEGLKDATEKATEPISAMSDAYESVMGTADKTTTSVANLKQEMQNSVDATNDMVDAINDRTNETATSIGLLESYKGTIEEYANKTGLSKTEQEKLKIAIDEVNDACGTQYSVVDAANGKIADETGVVMDNTDAIIENIKQKEKQLKVEALSEDYKDVYKQQYDDMQLLNEATEEYEKLQDEYTEACKKHMDTGAYTDEQLQTMWNHVQEAEGIMDGYQEKVDTETASLNNLAQGMGIIEAGTEPFKIAFEEMGADIEGSCSKMDISMDDFYQKMVDAGIESSSLSYMSAEDFDRLYDKCGGDVDKLIRKLKEYNDTHLDEKEAYVYTNGYDVNKQREEWNKGTWYPKRADVTITSSGITTGPLSNNAAGGIRLDAEGGIVPYAGIATSAVPLDIVGEDGAEAIVPLTNRQYSLPFAQLIAEEIGELEGAGNTIYNNTYYLDGIQITGSDADDLNELLGKYVTMGGY